MSTADEPTRIPSGRPLGFALGALALAVAVAVAGLAAEGGAAKRKGAKKEQTRPNIVLVMTDDQTVESMRVMPIVERKLADAGVSFSRNFASFPLCCPSRATLLTGQYPDNHGVRTNLPPAGGFAAFRTQDGNSLPVWLRKAGYHTAHIGKYLNGYGAAGPDTEVPPGWSEWYGSLDNPDAYVGGTYTMYGYTLNENGTVVHYGSTPDVVDPATYQTDVYAAKAEELIRRRAPKRKPFFLSVAPLAPHTESGLCVCAGDDPRAAPRHQGAFAGISVPRPPSFDEADLSDKPAAVRALPRINARQNELIDARYRAQLESLLAVDEMVGGLVDAVKDKGELGRTVFIFTADNGWFGGEHRIRGGKILHYEESSRVPLILRGPGIPKGKMRPQLSANIDLAPTILDLAEAKARRPIDGRSLMPLIERKRFDPGRAILIEAFGDVAPEDPDGVDLRYSAVRTSRYVYVETGAEQELYDLEQDPFQLQSRHADPALAEVRLALDGLLARLTECAGRSCRFRPALKLKLRGRRCPPGKGRVELVGRDRDLVVDERIFVKGRGRIEAIATLLDGRRVTLQRRAPRAC
ncbi:MAG: sulfatase family protein [Solirubrobacterales bacterium]